jgi:hypothetical protein
MGHQGKTDRNKTLAIGGLKNMKSNFKEELE